MDATDDERVRRLQRIAYGADASTEERNAALAELDRLAHVDAGIDDAPAAATPHSSDEAVADVGADDPGISGLRRPKRPALRVGLITGAVALAVGVAAGFAAGWQSRPSDPADGAGSTGTSGPVELGPRLHADVFAAMPIALETDAARVFDRRQTAADTPHTETPLADVTALVGQIDTRLLATSPAGVAVFAARDDTDLCLIATFTDGGAASVCTQRGRFPSQGLRMAVGGPDVIVDVGWSPEGVLQLTTAR
ncbi:hypothetical protein LQ757_15345 [Agromyces sp. SYSU K20354]|uniref:hypothetical protein n=1 Tax=Agromyces cavernae TaxID=2898659 RepID=UPI001E4E116D|nr:hypothetical protein [Agromyces cavernae]MCD2443654.1 hypothetical protein [Agromyces cavernae]